MVIFNFEMRLKFVFCRRHRDAVVVVVVVAVVFQTLIDVTRASDLVTVGDDLSY